MCSSDLTGEARRRAIYPLVLFVADADDRARQGYAMLRDRFPELPLAPVFNENIPRLADWREKFPLTFHGVGSLTIPALTPVLRSVIDRPGFSFVGYAMKTTDPTTELYGWMRKVFVPLREMESRLLLDELLLELKRTG